MKSYRITIEVDLDTNRDLVEAKVSADGGYSIYEEELQEEENE